MKCPKCGFEMQEEQLYCEHCGMEIQMVPDFEPEIENSISETLTTIVEELSDSSEKESSAAEAEDLAAKEWEAAFEENGSIIGKIISSRKLFLVCTISMSVLAVVLFIFGFFLLQYNSKGYQLSKAIGLADKGNYEKAVECLQKAESIDAEDANIFFLMAEYYFALEREEDAILALKNIALSTDFSPEDIDSAYGRLVDIYRKKEAYQAINDLLLACTDTNIIYMYQNYMAYPPEFSYIEGTYQEIIPLKLSSNTSGKIYYTTDGTLPDEDSPVYTTPVFMETGTYVISAFFVNDYGIRSETVTKTYNIELNVPQTPEISIYSGEYTEPTMIEVSVPEGCTVYYTTDGSEPNTDSTQYSGAISMPLGTSNFKFIAYSKEGVTGEIISRTYTLKLDTAYSVNDALGTLSQAMVDEGYILDMYGRKEGIQGRYIYKYGSVNHLEDGQNYYFIYEYYEDLAENQSKTGRIFGFNITTGECGIIALDEQWNYSFVPLSAENE